MKKVIRFIKYILAHLGASLVAYLFTYVINMLILDLTPLVKYEYEDLRQLVRHVIAAVIFLLVMLLKPLIDQIHISAKKQDELKRIYVSKTGWLCVTFVVYLLLVYFTPIGWFELTYAPFVIFEYISSHFLLAMLYALIAYSLVMIVANILLYLKGLEKLPDEEECVDKPGQPEYET